MRRMLILACLAIGLPAGLAPAQPRQQQHRERRRARVPVCLHPEDYAAILRAFRDAGHGTGLDSCPRGWRRVELDRGEAALLSGSIAIGAHGLIDDEGRPR